MSGDTWREGTASAVTVMNGMDAICTLLWIYLGLAIEANALMANLLDRGPVLFVVAKLAMAFGGVWLLRTFWERRLARFGMWAVFSAYALLMVWHGFFAAIALGF